MITIQDGNYHYTDEIGIHDIQLQIKQGETVGLMGPNGAGKSTLFKILVGLLPLSSGQYHFKDWTEFPSFDTFKTSFSSCLISRIMRKWKPYYTERILR